MKNFPETSSAIYIRFSGVARAQMKGGCRNAEDSHRHRNRAPLDYHDNATKNSNSLILNNDAFIKAREFEFFSCVILFFDEFEYVFSAYVKGYSQKYIVSSSKSLTVLVTPVRFFLFLLYSLFFSLSLFLD